MISSETTRCQALRSLVYAIAALGVFGCYLAFKRIDPLPHILIYCVSVFFTLLAITVAIVSSMRSMSYRDADPRRFEVTQLLSAIALSGGFLNVLGIIMLATIRR